MVIEIIPRSRSIFNDIATLKVTHSRGVFETPNRMVNRHDLNAKDNLGADISLTRTSKTFIAQEIVTTEKLRNLITINGYLGQIYNRLAPLISRADKESGILLYPSLTIETAKSLMADEKYYKEYVKFFCDLATELKLESIAIPIYHELNDIVTLVSKRNLQIIPVLDLRDDTKVFSERFLSCLSTSSNIIPIIGFKFSTYRHANKGYNLVMDNLDKLHEMNKATLMVDAPRYIRSLDYSNVSSLHYSPFYISDIVAERFQGASGRGGQNKKPSFRLFSKAELTIPVIESNNNYGGLDIEKEMALFESDKKLQELLDRTFKGENTDNDLKGYRRSYISRVHENIRTRQEFREFQKNIDSNTAEEYLYDKKPMKEVITSELKEANRL